jgi:hypothetical protein
MFIGDISQKVLTWNFPIMIFEIMKEVEELDRRYSESKQLELVKYAGNKNVHMKKIGLFKNRVGKPTQDAALVPFRKMKDGKTPFAYSPQRRISFDVCEIENTSVLCLYRLNLRSW